MLLPQTDGWMHEFANLSITTNQIDACPNRAGTINFVFSLRRFLMAHAKVLFDVARDLVLGRFELKNLQYLRRKVLKTYHLPFNGKW